MSVTRYHAELTKIDEVGNQQIIYPKTTISDVYTDSKSGIDISNKLSYYAICSDPFSITAKKVTIPGFVLNDGVHVTIRFIANNAQQTTTVDEPWSLQINTLTAYPIKLRIGDDGKSIFRIVAGTMLHLVFDKLSQSFIQIENLSLLKHTAIADTTTQNMYLLLSDSNTGTFIRDVDTCSKVYLKSGVLYSPYFSGDGSKITNLSASNIGAGTISNDRLPTISGLTAASYGPSTAKTLAHGDKFNVPYVTVNNKGLVTAIKNIELGLPSTYNGNAATATKLQTARTMTIGNTARTFDGSANVSWSLDEIGAAAKSHTHLYAGSESAGGPANSAVKLETSRTITVGTTSKYFNGTANVSWSLAEIGAAAASHTHPYSQVTPVWVDDWNTATKTGFYYGPGTNAPYAGSWYGRVSAYGNDNNYSIYQEIYQVNHTTTESSTSYDIPKYVREFHYGAWMPWVDMSARSQMKNAGAGTCMWIQWARYDDGTYALVNSFNITTIDTYFILPQGTWLAIYRIYTQCIPGGLVWHLEKNGGGTVSQWHSFDKTKGQGSYQTIISTEIFNNSQDTLIMPPKFDAIPNIYPNGQTTSHDVQMQFVRIV